MSDRFGAWYAQREQLAQTRTLEGDAALTPDEVTRGHAAVFEASQAIQSAMREDMLNPLNILPGSQGKLWAVPVTLKTGLVISSDTNDWSTTELQLPDSNMPFTRILVAPCVGVYVLVNLDSRATQIRVGSTWYPQAQINVPSGSAPQEIIVPRAHYSVKMSCWNNATATANQSYPTMVTFIDLGPRDAR